ncbi:MAG: hypothetical protein L6Q97_21980, partial [Thermoanaerobaculia bacterium]|nr:hypothetical protein [Thermoanaerobaculia bacterium]
MPPQHYLSPNQIKPNYSYFIGVLYHKGNMLCVTYTRTGQKNFYFFDENFREKKWNTRQPFSKRKINLFQICEKEKFAK